MSSTVTLTETQATVPILLNYLAPDEKLTIKETPFSYTFSPQPEGRPQTNQVYEAQSVDLKDIRSHDDIFLDKIGFEIQIAPTALAEGDFSDGSKIESDYYPEVERILKKAIPEAKKVITYNYRTRLHKPKTGIEGYDFTSTENFPVLRPHIDLTPEQGALLVEKSAPGYKGRALIINAWRPIRGNVLDAPLAVADPRTLNDQAKVLTRIIYRDSVSTSFAIRNAGNIEWYYQSAQRPEEVLLFKQYDSERPEHTPAHSAFSDPRYDGVKGVLPRYSVETRSVVLLDE